MKMKRGLLKPAIKKLFEKKKDWSCEELYALYPDENEISLRGYRAEFKEPKNNKKEEVITKIEEKKTKNSQSNDKSSTLQFDTSLMTENDVLQVRMLYKEAITRIDLDMRTRLDAAHKLMTLKDKQGQINMEDQSEQERQEQLSRQNINSLVQMLKERSQEEV